jgi:hypothetical protein
MANRRVTITVENLDDFIKLHVGSSEPIFVSSANQFDWLWYISGFEVGVPLLIAHTAPAKSWCEHPALGSVVEASIDIE